MTARLALSVIGWLTVAVLLVLAVRSAFDDEQDRREGEAWERFLAAQRHALTRERYDTELIQLLAPQTQEFLAPVLHLKREGA